MGVVTPKLMERVTADREGHDRLLMEALAMLDEHGLLLAFRERLEKLKPAS